MLTIYIYNCIKIIMVGITCELREQLQYKSFSLCIKLMSVHQLVAILIDP